MRAWVRSPPATESVDFTGREQPPPVVAPAAAGAASPAAAEPRDIPMIASAVILAGFRNGHEPALRQLISQFSPRLRAFAARYSHDDDEVLDLVQETWIRAHERRATLRDDAAFVGWLFAICRSVCVTRMARARGRRHETRSDEAIAHASVPAEDPLAHLEHAESRSRLADAVLRLTERQRDVVVMRLIEGRSTRDTAEALQCAEGTVKATLHQALARLRQLMEA